MSSFTPDELRKREIKIKYRESFSLTSNMIEKMKRRIGINIPYIQDWPQGTTTFCDELIKILNNNLIDSGLFICQSYASGINSLHSPNFIMQLIKDIDNENMTLVDFYSKIGSSQFLYTIFKGNKKDAIEKYRLFRCNDLTAFHGRSSNRYKVKLKYSILK